MIADLESKLSVICECLKEESSKRLKTEAELKELASIVTQIKRERGLIREQLKVKIEKLNSLSTRNFNKRLNRQKAAATSLKCVVAENMEKISLLEKGNEELNNKLTEALKKKA